MKAYFQIPLIASILLFIYGCSQAQPIKEETSLTAAVFAEKISTTTDATIIDVRTPEEYSNGHLQHATNIDWNGNAFEKEISELDPSKPTFVYCLSGRRSAAAAEKMRSMGFSKVYELNGGILTWRSAGFPETTGATNVSGMDQAQFQTLITSDKLVLVDFYATWCAPCKKMEPHLNELSKEMKDKVVIIRLDADENQSLAKELHIEALPTLLLYKNNNLVWSQTGYMSKEEIAKQLK